MTQKYWGFDVKNIDKKVRPQDDFYRYANGGWLRKVKIPLEESRWGSFTMLRYKTEKQLRNIVNDCLSTKTSSWLRVHSLKRASGLVCNMYASAVDMKTRNRLDIGPLASLRMLVRDIKTKKDLLAVIARLHVLGISPGWGAVVDQDSKNSSRYLLHLWQGGLTLPDRDYYLLDRPEQKRVRAAFKQHIKRLLTLSGFSPEKIRSTSAAIFKIETALAGASMKKEDIRDPENTYHKLSVAKLQKLSPNVSWRAYFSDTHASGVREIIVGQPKFFKALSTLLDTVSLEEWNLYVEWHLIDECASLLSQKFINEQFNFYGKVLTGSKRLKPLWRRALGAVGVVGEALGRLYVEKHFPPSSKHEMDALVSDLFDVYEDRIKALDWMSSSTKRRAVIKLRTMCRKIGYPKKWKQYKGLQIYNDDYFGNMLRAEEWEYLRQMRKLSKKVDRAEWFMTPQTVNAYFSPNLNEIAFPAAILQWPFFDPRADAAINYAGIGSVIGHEMTHGFDDQGAKFDGKGNMRSWWNSSDRKKFMAKGKILVKQYNSFEAAPGVNVNGQLTLGENIADLGGLVIAWDAYQKHLAKTGPSASRRIDGLTPEKRFFLGYAQMERELSRPEATKMRALTDPHSPAENRINGPLVNFEPFYKTFGVTKKDKLYSPPVKRAKIW